MQNGIRMFCAQSDFEVTFRSSGLDLLGVSRVPHLKARRKDSPLLPVMIPTGEDGQVRLFDRRFLMPTWPCLPNMNAGSNRYVHAHATK